MTPADQRESGPVTPVEHGHRDDGGEGDAAGEVGGGAVGGARCRTASTTAPGWLDDQRRQQGHEAVGDEEQRDPAHDHVVRLRGGAPIGSADRGRYGHTMPTHAATPSAPKGTMAMAVMLTSVGGQLWWR